MKLKALFPLAAIIIWLMPQAQAQSTRNARSDRGTGEEPLASPVELALRQTDRALVVLPRARWGGRGRRDAHQGGHRGRGREERGRADAAKS